MEFNDSDLNAFKNLTLENPNDPSEKKPMKLGELLGKGAFAGVYQYNVAESSTSYAGKIIPRRITASYEGIFLEIEIHKKLKHKNVVKLISTFEHPQGVVLILELCSYKSLHHVLSQRIVVTEPEIRYVVQQILLGLHYIHGHFVIHRDLKPGNVLVNEDFVLKIGDFGFAAEVGKSDDFFTCGTPNYISPEGFSGNHYKYESDIWSLGCMMYAMIAGCPPFDSSTLFGIRCKVLKNKYSMPAIASIEACRFIDSMLQSNPNRRPSAQQALEHEFLNTGFFPPTLHPLFGEKCTVFFSVDDSEDDLESDWIANFKSDAFSEDSLKFPVNNVTQYIQKNCSKLPHSVVQHVRMKSPSGHNYKMLKVLRNCLNALPCLPVKGEQTGSPGIPLFVTKWIDYTNKYGFGFKLSDKSDGFCFIDGTRMTLHADETKFDFYDTFEKCTTFDINNSSKHLDRKLKILRKCCECMSEDLDGNIKCETNKSKIIPQMRRLLRMPNLLIMELTNNTVQVNFNDTSKLIITEGDKDFAVSYVIKGNINSKWLVEIEKYGWELEIIKKLLILKTVLLTLWELDSRLM